MVRWSVLALCLSVSLAAAARAHEDERIVLRDWAHVRYVDWDGTVSRADIRIANLPFADVATEPKLTLRLAFPWVRPMCLDCWRSGQRDRLPHRPLVIRKPPDKASPMLRNANQSKRPLRQVVIRARDTSGNDVTIVLGDVRVDCFTGYTPSIVPGTPEWDFFTLEYGFIGITPTPPKDTRLVRLSPAE